MSGPQVSAPPPELAADPLERLLLQLAARSGPAPGVMEAIERRAVAAFEARSRATSGAGGNSRRARARVRGGRPFRQALAAGLAAAAILVGGGAVASAGSAPGRPLFAVRLAVEQALLPADPPSDRLTAQLAVLDRRLSEAAEAAPDSGAVADATRAYRATLADLLPLVHRAPEQAEVVVRSLIRQLASIDRLDAEVTPAARDDLDDAARAARWVLATIDRGDWADRSASTSRSTSRRRPTAGRPLPTRSVSSSAGASSGSAGRC